jgi:TRAP-type mannitol/chloroaromatic compound transport system permease large subunit
MRSVSYLVVGGAILLVLHLFMLGGGHAGTAVPESAGRMGEAPAMAIAAAGGQLLGAAEPVHDMLATCVAVLVGLLLVGAASTRSARRAGPPLPRRAGSAPVDQPPTPPPIAWGISRS